jgi:Zinc finger, C3HC4 type (RING finger)
MEYYPTSNVDDAECSQCDDIRMLVQQLTAEIASLNVRMNMHEEVLNNIVGRSSLVVQNVCRDLLQPNKNDVEPPRLGADECRQECIVCAIAPRCFAIINCGHYQLCEQCVYKVKYCPICRCEITDRLRIYE